MTTLPVFITEKDGRYEFIGVKVVEDEEFILLRDVYLRPDGLYTTEDPDISENHDQGES